MPKALVEGYEFEPGTPEQQAVFIELQRDLLRLFARWPGDAAVAVFGAALGSACSQIETQYALHLEECGKCRENYGTDGLGLREVAKNNLDYYYETGVEQLEMDKEIAASFVEAFFKRRH